jgi:hypothetical protein
VERPLEMKVGKRAAQYHHLDKMKKKATFLCVINMSMPIFYVQVVESI